MSRIARWMAQPGFAAALFFSAYLVLFQPAQVYDGNERLFRFGLVQLGLLLVPVFVALLVALATLALAGGPRSRRGVAVAVGGACLAAWAGGTFFTASHGFLDGRELLRLGSTRELVVNAVLYALVLAAGCLLAARWPRPFSRFLLVLTALLALQAAAIAVRDAKPWVRSPDVESLASLSPTRNVIVVLLDGFQSDVFAEIVAHEPAFADAMPGFTFFRNAVAHAPTTYLSMPGIHTGVPPTDGRKLRALYEQGVVRHSFVANLARAGYDAILVNPILQACPAGARCFLPEEAVYGERVILSEYAAMLLNFSVFRTVPGFARPWIYREGRWIVPWRLWERQAQTANGLLDQMGAGARADNPRPAVRFLHLFNTHAPAQLDGECHAIGPQQWTRPHVRAQDRCAVATVARFLGRLRERGVYDASVIVVLADHGAGLPLADGTVFHLGSSASPLLLVKPLGAAGPMRTESRLVGLVDVAATICAQVKSCTASGGRDAFGPDPGPATYEFVDYHWDPAFFAADEVAITDRYTVSGPPERKDSWHREPPVPPGPVTRLSFGTDDPASALGPGWGAVEHNAGDDGRWAIGDEADLSLRVADAAPARLRVDVSTHRGNPAERMEVFVNGTHAGGIEVTTARTVHELALANGLLHPGVNRIVFRFAQANPGGPGDARRLAVFFHDLALQRGAAPTAAGSPPGAGDRSPPARAGSGAR